MPLPSPKPAKSAVCPALHKWLNERFYSGSLVSILLLAGIKAVAADAAVIPATPSAAPESIVWSFVRMIGALLVVFGVFFGAVWLFRNWQRVLIRKGHSPKLNVLEVRSLGSRQAVYVVGYENQRFLVASSPAGINLLTHLPPADGEVPNEPIPSFTDALQMALSGKR